MDVAHRFSPELRELGHLLAGGTEASQEVSGSLMERPRKSQAVTYPQPVTESPRPEPWRSIHEKVCKERGPQWTKRYGEESLRQQWS